MFDFSPIQIIIVLVIALIVFGPKKLPEMGRSLGRGIREFKASVTGDPAPPPTPAPPPGPAPTALVREDAAPDAAARAPDDDEADEVLEGVVMPGSEPPRPPAGG